MSKSTFLSVKRGRAESWASNLGGLGIFVPLRILICWVVWFWWFFDFFFFFSPQFACNTNELFVVCKNAVFNIVVSIQWKGESRL